uniref:Uncharacterized protein n=1 Tax=Arundo donax TaxID=35708 RepID=A0A0A9ECI1_ARUDO
MMQLTVASFKLLNLNTNPLLNCVNFSYEQSFSQMFLLTRKHPNISILQANQGKSGHYPKKITTITEI